MKKISNYMGNSFKVIKLPLSITLMLMGSSILNAADIQLASISNNSEAFDLPNIEEGTTSFSSMVFNDLNGNGIREEGENFNAGVTVKLIDKDGNEINVGPDGILGNEDDSPGGVRTNDDGSYSFSNITHKFYRVQVEVE